MKLEKKSQIKAVIWDMDGVLVDSETYYAAEEVNFYKTLGMDVDEGTAKGFMGTPFTQYFPVIAKKYNKQIPIETAIEKYNALIENIYLNLVTLNPEADHVLKNLKHQYEFALATSTSEYLASQVIKRFNLSKYFEFEIFGDQVSKGKPDPEIFLKACEGLGMNPEDTIIVEDSQFGIKAGKAAGIKVIAYKTNHNSQNDFSEADYVVQDLRDIPKIIENINES